MKLTNGIAKNLKLLFRSRESAYTVIFGPLLIILLVSFAFMGGDDFDVRVGTYAPVSTEFSEQVIDTLNQQGYAVSVYDQNTTCIASVSEGSAHACILFSEWEAGNGTVPIRFYLDMSRPNIVYRILEDISSTVDIESSEVREQLTSDTLERIRQASRAVAQGRNRTLQMQERIIDSEQQLRVAQIALSQLGNLSVDVEDIRSVKAYNNGLAQNTKTVVNASVAALDDAQQTMKRIARDCRNCSFDLQLDVEELDKHIDQTKLDLQLIATQTTQQQLTEANRMLESTIASLELLRIKIAEDEAARQTVRNSVVAAAGSAEANRKDIEQLAIGIGYAQGVLDSQTVNATTISTPVAVSLHDVASADDQLSITYPYLLILVVMFIGMLLASILVVTEKTSRARFRNFTTPLSDNYQIAISFATAAFLLLIEVVAILLISNLFIAQPLQVFSLSTIIILLLAVVIFTFIGMVIGQLVGTQEAAMIASISIGSVLLFVSNLVIPIEGMASAVRSLTSVNPYVVLSELLKKSMFYGVKASQLSRQILLLLLLCTLLLAVTLWIQRRSKNAYFRKDALVPHARTPLQLGTRIIHNELELYAALDRMTSTEFSVLIKSSDNAISVWVKDELRNWWLSRQLRTADKSKMMHRLDKYLEKHGKHLKQ